METIYDWVTIAIFAGLVVLFLQRSTAALPRDNMLQYLGAAVGCGVANWLGNQALGGDGWPFHVAAVAAIAATVGYIFVVLKPLDRAGD